jgi:hypothetical protein
VKLPDSDDVYLTPAGVLAQLGIYGELQEPAYRYFLDLQAVQEDRVAVDAIRLRDASGTRELVKVFTPPTEATGDSAATAAALRATWEWKTGGGTRGPALAKSKVDAVLNSLVNIRATDLADPGAPASSYGLDTPAREAALVLADGRHGCARVWRRSSGCRRQAGRGLDASARAADRLGRDRVHRQ